MLPLTNLAVRSKPAGGFSPCLGLGETIMHTLDFNQKRGFIRDMDGVIYHGKSMSPSSQKLLMAVSIIPRPIAKRHHDTSPFGNNTLTLSQCESRVEKGGRKTAQKSGKYKHVGNKTYIALLRCQRQW